MRGISRTGAKTHGVYVMKGGEDRPEYWNEMRTFERHIIVLAELLDEVFSNTESNDLKIVIDRHDNYDKGDAREVIWTLAKHHRINVRIIMEDSESGKHKDMVQAQDAASFALGDFVVTRNEGRIRIIGTDPKEITKTGRHSRSSKR